MNKEIHERAGDVPGIRKATCCLMTAVLAFVLTCTGAFQSVGVAHAATTHKVTMTTLDGFDGTWYSEADVDKESGNTTPGVVIANDGEPCKTDPTMWQILDSNGQGTGLAGNFGTLLADKNADGQATAFEASADGGQSWFDFDWEETPVTSDLTVRGKWVADTAKKTVTISYNDNKEHSEEEQVMEYDKGAKANALPTPTRNAYSFEGWYYQDEDGNEYRYVPNVTVINDDMEVYAKWNLVDVSQVLGSNLPAVSASNVLTGTCNIGPFTWKPKNAKKQVATFKLSDISGKLGATNESSNYSPNYSKRAVCVDHGAHATKKYYSQKAKYKAIVVNTNKKTGKVVYLGIAYGYAKTKGASGSITANGDPDSTFKITSKYSDGNAKTVTYSNGKSGKNKDELTFSITQDGKISLKSNDGNPEKTKEQRVGFAREAYISQVMKVRVAKDSTNPDITNDNGCYSLEDAEYAVYKTEDDAKADRNRIDTLKTGKDGVTGESKNLVPADYYLKEVKAPKGYATDNEVHKASNAGNSVVTVESHEVPQNDPVNIALGKYSDEKEYDSNGNSAMGGGSFEGAEFLVQYYDGMYDSVDAAEASGNLTRTWVYKTDRLGRIYPSVASYLLEKSSDGKYHSGDVYRDTEKNVVFPLGTYVVKEIKAPNGYLLPAAGTDAAKGFCTKVVGKGTSEHVDTWNEGGEEIKAAETIKRADFEFVKAGLKGDDASNAKRLANIPFKVTSTTTDESHVVVTDENGQFSSAANAHSNQTNGNDWFLNDDADKSGKGLDPDKGVWFGKYSKDDDRQTSPRDDRGAMDFDTYTIEELRCDANAGYVLVNTKFTISKDQKVVDLGTLVDRWPVIGTTASDGVDGDKKASVDTKMTIDDNVTFENVNAGSPYVLTGQEDGSGLQGCQRQGGRRLQGVHPCQVQGFREGSPDL